MLTEVKGSIGPGARRIATGAVYSFVAAQFILLVFVVCKASQRRPIALSTWFMLPLYLGPLIFGILLRVQMARLVRSNSMSQGAANICNEWLLALLASVYAFLLEFGKLMNL
jgi:hypothetical protein